MPFFLVTKKDTVLQSTGYLVQATDAENAVALVNDGRYIEETATVTLDLLDTETTEAIEISEYAGGKEQ